ncbi:MAG: hypothetical protein H6974_02500 [Gammaproteobacteria bacterium]|nr:hypothetical protein [Gammaproteobacteria bacterium]
MGITVGMRGRDLRAFMQVARDHHLVILIRHTNEDSLKYVGVSGYYPKPAAIKAKTADQNPPLMKQSFQDQASIHTHQIAGLVVHPGFQPQAYRGAKVAKAKDCWEHTLETLSPTLMNQPVDLDRPDTWSLWGVERQGVKAPRWKWRVDIDPHSKHFGCLQLKSDAIPWSYIHGDYDLKDVIVLGKESDNQRNEGVLDGVKNFTPMLYGITFDAVLRALNIRVGIDMVQHGAEAQFAWHGDEPITVVYPDWRFETLLSAETVQSWYRHLNREVLGKMGVDYQHDRSRMFHFGPEGLFKPGCFPGGSWG